jgi:lipopolysaccharide heptosyltransferase II
MSKVLDIWPGDAILVSRTDRLGDLILALPFIETLKVRYPECRIDVLASLYASPILENNERIDGILRVQNDQLALSRPYKKELFQKVSKKKYRAVVLLFPERRISRLLYQTGIENRIGTAGRFHSVFFNHHLMHSRKQNKKHELEYNLDFLRFFASGPTVKQPTVYVQEKEIKNARRLLKKRGVEGGFIILHPGSGGSAHRWTAECFMELHKKLVEAGHTVVITGSEEEGREYEILAKKMKAEPANIAGQTDLRTLAALLSLGELVVANSTGPLHLAAAVGTKVVGLFPNNRVMTPVRWGPWGKEHRVIQPEGPESADSVADIDGMSTISVERVACEVEAALAEA